MTNFDIHERIFKFVVRVLHLIKFLPKNATNEIIVNQLTRSATSVGANDQEADGVSSRKDFIHCYTIVRKEAKETFYWLKLVTESNPELKTRMNWLLKENEELIKIISSILTKSKPRAVVK